MKLFSHILQLSLRHEHITQIKKKTNPATVLVHTDEHGTRKEEYAHRALIASRHTECCPQFSFIEQFASADKTKYE
jgi:hypothetical protein